ncbi:MAG: GBS Bsp-like repeat-containing protein [Lachnospiraceae bacterium]|nr:GBS Bsp-like repeat-containing protein [Lachnospiraceae bacterium]
MKRKINRLLAGLVVITMGISGYGNTCVFAADGNDPVIGSVSESVISEEDPEEDEEICEMEFMSLSEDDLVDSEELNRDISDQEEVILEATANFTPRTTAPTSDNPYFFNSKYNPFVGTSYGPPATTSNCTWYAYGRASEILGRKAGLCTANASKWYGYTKDGYQRGDTPRLGAVACKKGKNHVAVVEGIDYANNTVALSNSAWGGDSFYMVWNAKASDYQYIYLGDFSTDNTNPPSITKTEITEVNRVSGYYKVKATVTAEAGLDRVQFPTWTAYNDQDDIISDWGTSSRASGNVTDLGNNTYSAQYTVYISDHNGERGTYYTHVYAYDKYGRTSEAGGVSADMNMEGNAPAILSAKVTEVNRSGGYYNVVAKVHADAALDRIEFPTWTDYNGQDDLPASWPKGTVTSLGNNDYEATYTVHISDHNNETGKYITHVYAFDCYGRYSSAAIESVNMNEFPSEPRICAKINLQIIQYVVPWLYGGYNYGKQDQNHVTTIGRTPAAYIPCRRSPIVRSRRHLPCMRDQRCISIYDQTRYCRNQRQRTA